MEGRRMHADGAAGSEKRRGDKNLRTEAIAEVLGAEAARTPSAGSLGGHLEVASIVEKPAVDPVVGMEDSCL